MDEIAFRIAHRELGIGPQDCVEIAINGRDLCDLLREVEQPIEVAGLYAGLEPEAVLGPNSRFLDDPRAPAHFGDPAHEHVDDGGRRRTFVLRCNCGDHRCSYVLARIRLDHERVMWSDFFGSHAAPPAAYQGLGPFEFDRMEYEKALARTRRTD